MKNQSLAQRGGSRASDSVGHLLRAQESFSIVHNLEVCLKTLLPALAEVTYPRYLARLNHTLASIVWIKKGSLEPQSVEMIALVKQPVKSVVPKNRAMMYHDPHSSTLL